MDGVFNHAPSITMKIQQSAREFHVALQANLQPIWTARNLGMIVRSIAENLRITPRVEVAMV